MTYQGYCSHSHTFIRDYYQVILSHSTLSETQESAERRMRIRFHIEGRTRRATKIISMEEYDSKIDLFPMLPTKSRHVLTVNDVIVNIAHQFHEEQMINNDIVLLFVMFDKVSPS